MTQKTENKNKLSKQNIQDIIALTPMQDGLLFHYLKDSENNDYLNQLELTLNGNIQIEHFENAWQQVVNTNEMLRTVFLWEGVKNPVQVVKKEASVDFTYIENNTVDIETLKQEDKAKGFNISESCFRLTLVKVATETYKLLITNHHIIYDGWSNGIMIKSVLDTYSKLIKAEPVTLVTAPVFKQYAKLKVEQTHDSKAYWDAYLKDYEVSTFIASNLQRGEEGQEDTSKTIHLDIAPNLVSKLESYSKAKQISVASIFYSTWGILMQKYSNTEDILFGTAISDRPKEIRGIENAIGLYIKTIPFRCTTLQNSTLEAIVLKSNTDLIDLQEKGNGSLNDIIKVINNNQSGKGEVFETMFTFENYPINTAIFSNKDIKIEDFTSTEKTHYALEAMVEKENGYKFTLTYTEAAIDTPFVTALLGHYKTILQTIVDQPETKLSHLSITTATEQTQYLDGFNATETTYSNTSTLYDLFEKQVELNPNKAAISFKGKSITYRALETKANNLAHKLIEQGIAEEDAVGIYLDRSPEMIIAIMGVLKSGAAYLPLDVTQPNDRILKILEDSSCNYCITNTEEATLFNCKNININGAFINEEQPSIKSKAKANNLAYYLYTSGSTGTPKGVMVEHHAVVNFIEDRLNVYNVTNDENILLFAPIYFDASVEQLFVALSSGAAIVVIEKETLLDANDFNSYLLEHKVTHIDVVPSFLREMDFSKDLLLKRIVSGGEAIDVKTINKCLALAELHNTYGPTETTVVSTSKFYKKGEEATTVTIGTPIANTTCYVLDKNNNLCPIGIQGELHIGGVGVARGYVNNKTLTNERFISSPFKVGERLYKTGDLAKWLPNGELDYLGRLDNQVKIRGHRIELEEIENGLRNNTQISEALCNVFEDNNGSKVLCAFYTGEKEIDKAELISHLKTVVPSYMIPSFFSFEKQLPTTTNGKLNRKGLKFIPKEVEEVTEEQIIPEKAEEGTEDIILNIWQQVLQTKTISKTDNFFEIGGDSLKLIRVNSLLGTNFSMKIKITDLFKYASIKTLAEFIDGEKEKIAKEKAIKEETTQEDTTQEETTQDKTKKEESIKEDTAKLEEKPDTSIAVENDDIAIIGMAGRFPKANSIEAFWNNLKGGVEGITVKDNEDDKNRIKAKGHLEERTAFDNSFFGYTPREAAMMDPQTRVLHECVWEALEDSGYNSYQYDGKIALFAGSSFNPYWGVDVNSINSKDLVDNFDVGTYAERDSLASRISYKLNLRGAGMTLLTACSSSLVAVDMACSKLQLDECDMALAGGVSITFHDDNGYLHKEGMILSSDGHCRAFDKAASGTVGGNGAGVVVLKKLKKAIADNDNVLAIIKGTATNNDGHYKVGYTAPSVTGQAEVIKEALAKAKINSEDVTYVEAHGTGTSLGDPIEIEGLTTAFNSNKKQYCAVGSVKTNIGHLDGAAGVAGLIKTVLALKNKKLLPSLHFKEANPEIDLENSPFYINTTFQDWKTDGKPRIAGVSSFGIGGTNAHVILQEAPEVEVLQEKEDTQLIVISGHSKEALEANTEKLEHFITSNTNVNTNQLSHLLQTTREHFLQRRFVIAENTEDLKAKLSKGQYKDGKRQNTETKNVTFMFTGQGAQYTNMTADLYSKNCFYAKQIDLCLDIIKKQTGEDFKSVLFSQDALSKINETYYTQALLFTVEYAMAKYLMHLNIKPTQLIGHSIGEYAAACFANVFSLEAGLKIVLKRGALMQKAAPGTMLSISRSANSILKIKPENIDMATINTEESCVVSGSHDAISAFQTQLEREDIPCVTLKTSHGFHSSTMDPVLEEFEAYLKTLNYNNPDIPFVSNYTGTWITNEDAKNPNYWAKHLRHTVKFSEGIQTIQAKGDTTYIEVGPSRTLANFVKTILVDATPTVFNTIRHPKERKNDYNYFLQQIGTFWLEGFDINWKHLHENKVYRKLSLPTYAFQKNDFPLTIQNSPKTTTVAGKETNVLNWFYKENWKLSTLEQDQERHFNTDTFLIFSDNSSQSNQLIKTIREQGKQVIIVEKGEDYKYEDSKNTYTVNPHNELDFKTLSQAIEALQIKQYVYCWTLENSNVIPQANLGSLKSSNAEFYFCSYLFKYFKFDTEKSPYKFSVITNGVVNLNANKSIKDIASSAILALLQIEMQETQNSFNCIIDIDENNTDYSAIVDDLIYNVKERTVAYTNGFRFINIYEQYQPKTIANETILKENGVYVITGGIGNAALTIAEALVSKHNANVVLMGRSPLPNNLDLGKEYKEDKIQWINTLKTYGGSVTYKQGDITKHGDLTKVIKTIKEEYNTLNGIIHTAGNVNSDTFDLVNRIETKNIEAHFAPKVAGILNIYAETQAETIDFVWATSSLSTVLGAPSYAAYAGANNYMDQLIATYAKNSEGRKWISVKLDGLSFDDNTLINKKELVAVFETTLNQVVHDCNPIVSISNLQAKDGTETIIKRIWEQEVEEQIVTNKIKRPEHLSNFVAPTTAFQKQIAKLWADSFGYDEIGIQDNYFDLGGDSLKAIAITSKMEQITGKTISLPSFLGHPTIEELSVLIENTDQTEEFTYPKLVHDATNAHDTFPLTPIQLAYLLGRSSSMELGGISTHGYIEIEASLDADKLSKALQKVVDRHAILRTVVTQGGNQKILEGDLKYDLEIENISTLSETDKTDKIESVRATMSHQVFDVHEWPLFEMKVFQITNDKVYIFFGIDLIISDAGSTELFASELMQYYRNPDLKLPAIEFTFRDYVLGLTDIKKSPFYEKDKAYWMEKMKTFPSAPELPIKVSPSTIEVPRFERLEKIFNAADWKQLKRIASKNNITPSVLLCTAFTEVLAFWGNQQELALNMTLFNRFPFHEDIPKMMGDFTSLVLLNVQLDRQKSFFDNAKVVQKALFEAMDHRHYDGVECITELRRLKSLGDKAVMPVVFTSTLQENEDDELNFWNELGNIKKSISQTPQVFLDHQLMLKEGELILGWDYVEQLFDEDIIETMFNQYIQRIEKLLEDEIPEAVTVPEHHLELLQDYNNSFVEDSNTILQDLFYNEATLNSNAIAVENEDVQWTYKELFNKANQVAAFLKSKNIGRGDFVGVSTDRNEYTISNILGITIAGAAYVPIDNTHPEERKQYILEKSSCKWMLNVDGYAKENMGSLSTDKHEIVSKPDDIAYIIFTSGSTGQPKGVVIKHSAVVNTIVDINQRFNVTNEDRILGISSLTFDLSVYDIYGSFHAGARLVLLDNQRDVELIKDTIVNKGITVWNSVPAIMDMLTKYFDTDFVNNTISKVMLSGDWIPIPLPAKIKTHFPNANVISMGGATEASIWSIYYEVDKVEEHWKSIPYGYPLGNQTFYVLNATQEQCPVDVTGELYIGGVGVAEGYVNEEELTTNAFIQHETFGRIYKTGDYGVFRKEGHIEFLGRKDNQVKIRGYRVELGEISTHLRAYKGIKQAIAIDYTTDSGEKNLAAYYVSDQEIDGNTLKDYLSTLLPDYMLPAFISKIEDIPLTPNGKINRKALAIPKENLLTKNTKKEAPQTAIEKLVFSKWQEILKTEQIGIHDDFFLVGGNSIKLIELFKLLETDYPSIKVNKLFEYRTIHSFSSHLNEQTTEQQKPKKAKAKIAF